MIKEKFDNEDLKVLTDNSRFMVAVDAYRKGLCTIAQLSHLAFDGPPYLPRNLSPMAYVSLVIEIAQKLVSGELQIDPSAKDEFQEFYRQQLTDTE